MDPQVPMQPSTLWRRAEGRGAYVLPLVAAATVLFLVGLTLPVVHLRRGVSRDTYSVLTGILDLLQEGNVLLGLIILSFSVIFPAAKLTTLFFVMFVRMEQAVSERVVQLLEHLGRWSMLDVFVIAIMIGSMHLGIVADAEPRAGIYVFGSGIVLSMLCTMGYGYLVGASRAKERSRAASPSYFRWITLVSYVLFLAGLMLPLMDLEKWVFWSNEYSLVSATWRMALAGDVGLAVIVLLFVVVLPAARLSGLVLVRWTRSSRLLELLVALVDRWAMLDVFVLATLIVLVKIGDVASVEPRLGLWMLLLSVVLSLLDSWSLQADSRRSAV